MSMRPINGPQIQSPVAGPANRTISFTCLQIVADFAPLNSSELKDGALASFAVSKVGRLESSSASAFPRIGRMQEVLKEGRGDFELVLMEALHREKEGEE